jgi:toxin ParE1/3/4
VDADVAGRYEVALRVTFDRIARNPSSGRHRHFPHEELAGLRSIAAERPFNRFLVFYRSDEKVLTVERVIHGMRDLPRRLLDPPDTD